MYTHPLLLYSRNSSGVEWELPHLVSHVTEHPMSTGTRRTKQKPWDPTFSEVKRARGGGVMTSWESLPHGEVRMGTAWPQGGTVRSLATRCSRQNPVFTTHNIRLLGLQYLSSSFYF